MTRTFIQLACRQNMRPEPHQTILITATFSTIEQGGMDVGQEKDTQIREHEAEEKAWKKVAENKGWKCEVCGATILKADKEVFFLTKMCGLCEHRMGEE